MSEMVERGDIATAEAAGQLALLLGLPDGAREAILQDPGPFLDQARAQIDRLRASLARWDDLRAIIDAALAEEPKG